jgi:DNA-binding PadR family transcriptional regulator
MSERGGKREGAGRKPLDGRVTRCYALTPRHVEALERYRQQHNLTSSSEAIRHLIDSWQS